MATEASETPNNTATPATQQTTPEIDPALLVAATADAPVETPAAEAKPEDAKVEEVKETPDKLAAAAETIRKAKKHAKRQRELEHQLQKEKLRAETFARQVETEKAARSKDLEERELFRKDPLEAIKRLGVSARDLAKKAIEEGTPEAQLAALRAQFEADREKDRLALRQEFEAALQHRDQAAQQARAQEAFFGMIKPDTHPRLHTLDRELVLSMANSVFVRATKAGYQPSDQEVLDHVESLLAAPQNGTAGTTTPKTNPTGPTVAKPVAKPSPTSRTVTADLAGRRYSVPTNFDELDDHDQRIALAKMLEDSVQGS